MRLWTLFSISNGQILVLDEKGEYWVKFQIRRVPVTKERPHGLNYSLTLHGNDNERLVGFDNALIAPGREGAGCSRSQDTASGLFGRISIAMQPLCSRISGPRWMPY